MELASRSSNDFLIMNVNLTDSLGHHASQSRRLLTNADQG